MESLQENKNRKKSTVVFNSLRLNHMQELAPIIMFYYEDFATFV